MSIARPSNQALRTNTRERSKTSTSETFVSYLKQNLAPNSLLEAELMLLALAAGINDATTFPDYGVFASNQTGNTALLAVGALHLRLASGEVDLRDVGTSLGTFILGAIILGQLGYRMGRTRRSWLLFSNGLQTCLVFIAAALRKWVPTDIDDTPRYAVITLLAFASGGQVAMARTVDIPEITTAMVTSAYVDFVVDPLVLARSNRPRDRRGCFVLALLIGSFIGAALYREVEPAAALLLAGLIKSSVFFLLFCNRQHDTCDLERAASRAAGQNGDGNVKTDPRQNNSVPH